MRLRAHDQINISAVKSESLRPGEEFEISDTAGAELLKAHPGLFEEIAAAEKAEPAPSNKAEPAPDNKAAPAPISRGSMARRGR